MIPRLLTAFAVFACLTGSVSGQCRIVPGSGCIPAPPVPVCSGTPALGQTLHIDVNPGGLPVLLHVAAIGVPASVAIPVGPSLGICGGTCTFVLPSTAVWVSAGVLENLAIPKSPALVGVTIRTQAVLSVGSPGAGACLQLPAAVEFTIR